MEMTRRAVRRRSLVIVKQVNFDRSVRALLVPDRRRVLEARVDKLQRSDAGSDRLRRDRKSRACQQNKKKCGRCANRSLRGHRASSITKGVPIITGKSHWHAFTT